MPLRTIKPHRFQWSATMVNVTYAVVVLSIVLVAAQFWLYGVRYQRVFAEDTWYAVMLSNGQTYFGVLQQYGPDTVVLFNVYYLQATGDITAPAESTTEGEVAEGSEAEEAEIETESGLKLFKLTDDLHKPNDYLILNRNHILFWQHLSNDSPIAQAIEKNL